MSYTNNLVISGCFWEEVKNMEILAIVPARGGSKGIPHKNMTDLAGKPLMGYTFDAAKGSTLITKTILSTDDEDFADYARSEGIEVRMRPDELASDTAVMKDVINYHLDELEKEGYKADAFILLHPDAFDTDIYTEAYVTVSGAEEPVTLSDEYKDLVDPVADRIKEVAKTAEVRRYDEVYADASEAIEDAKQEVADAEAGLDNAAKELSDGMNEFERNVKRFVDFFAAVVCLIVFSPLFLICYILIKREDGGPAIFKQERIGRFGRPFMIYKFRSMRVDAEKDGPALYQHENETRMTKIGKFLREHHLDELPQLWNVVKGDMAFIGPRPERKYFIDQIMEHDRRYVYLYQIRPGVTSYATLYNGYTDTMEKMLRRLELDLYYLEHRSWWLDIKIITKTFLNIVFGKKF